MNYNQVEINKCPICNNDNILDIVKEKYSLDNDIVEFDFVYCENCDFVFQKNPLDSISIQNYYKYTASRYRSSENSRTKKALRKKQVDFIRQEFISNIDSILEIGADDGGFLNACIARWNTETYFDEINEVSCKILLNQGHKALIPNKKFDLVVLLHVFEHIIQPLDFLKTLKNTLNDDGLILIEIPNHTFWDEYDYTFSLEHTNYFSSKSLTEIISKAGYVLMNWEISSDEHYFSGKTRFIRCLIRKINEKINKLDLIKNHYSNSKTAKFNNLNNYILNCLKNKEAIGLYGIGEVVRSLNLIHKIDYNVKLFDSDKSKEFFEDIKINSPESLIEMNLDKLIITCNVYREIQDKLETLGFNGEVLVWHEINSY